VVSGLSVMKIIMGSGKWSKERKKDMKTHNYSATAWIQTQIFILNPSWHYIITRLHSFFSLLITDFLLITALDIRIPRTILWSLTNCQRMRQGRESVFKAGSDNKKNITSALFSIFHWKIGRKRHLKHKKRAPSIRSLTKRDRSLAKRDH